MYADDTKLFKGIPNHGDCMSMQHDLNSIKLIQFQLEQTHGSSL